MLDVYLVVIPEPGLRFEARLDEWWNVPLTRGFFAIDIGRQPDSWLRVHAPTVKMKIGVVVRLVGISAVEPNDVEVMVFNPNASCERSLGRFLSGLHVNHNTSHLSQELLSHKREVVIVLLEVAINDRHGGEAS